VCHSTEKMLELKIFDVLVDTEEERDENLLSILLSVYAS